MEKQKLELIIQTLLGAESWCADEIDIWFDNLQGFWRWNCNISRM